jgi:hypothetical protein
LAFSCSPADITWFAVGTSETLENSLVNFGNYFMRDPTSRAVKETRGNGRNRPARMRELEQQFDVKASELRAARVSRAGQNDRPNRS